MSKTRSAKPDTNVSFRTSIGGQALIEGILMRLSLIHISEPTRRS
mgnify:CR=1 FL=1